VTQGHPGRSCGPVAFTLTPCSGYPKLRAGDIVREAFAEVPIAAIDPLDIAALALTGFNTLTAGFRAESSSRIGAGFEARRPRRGRGQRSPGTRGQLPWRGVSCG
jgi:hypothetical protein